jgi:hypothetical protein
MASILSVSVTDEVATLVLDDASDLVIGERVHIAGTSPFIGTNRVDGSHLLTGVDLAADEVTIDAPTVDDLASTLTPGAVLSEVITWSTVEDLEIFLGTGTLAGDELTFAESCTDAANHWCYHRRRSSGYHDSPISSPEPNVTLGATILAGSYFRERGALDSIPSFQGFPMPTPVAGSLGQVLRLLRCNKPRIA